jgi:hypothetical protein
VGIDGPEHLGPQEPEVDEIGFDVQLAQVDVAARTTSAEKFSTARSKA